MKIRFLRHATMLISFGNKNILVDPLLIPAGVQKPFPTLKNGRGKNNPLVELPVSKAELKEILNSLDALLITHLHSDHFYECTDENTILPKNLPVICQPADSHKLKNKGFKNLYPVEKDITWEGVNITRTECRHGGIIIRQILGKGSGFILKYNEAGSSSSSIYISGDTVWCPFVKRALDQKPDIMILYAGAAQLPLGRSITMNETDIINVCKYAPDTKIAVVHMEAFNHCLLTRNKLKDYLSKKGLLSKVKILNDGEVYEP